MQSQLKQKLLQLVRYTKLKEVDTVGYILALKRLSRPPEPEHFSYPDASKAVETFQKNLAERVRIVADERNMRRNTAARKQKRSGDSKIAEFRKAGSNRE